MNRTKLRQTSFESQLKELNNFCHRKTRFFRENKVVYLTFVYFEVDLKGKFGAAGNNVEESSAISY